MKTRLALRIGVLTLLLTSTGARAASTPVSLPSPSCRRGTGVHNRTPPSECALPQAPASSRFQVRFDRVGYLPGVERRAVVLGSGDAAPSFRLYDLGRDCYVTAAAPSGPRVLDVVTRAGTRMTGDRIDLSALPGPGRYLVVLEDGSRFGPVVVCADAYAEVGPALLSFLRSQRCGETTAAVSGHDACHLYTSLSDGDSSTNSGDGVAVDPDDEGPVGIGSYVDVEGGWHDGGSYVKLVGSTSYTIAMSLLALRDHPEAFRAGGLGITRAELKTELRWGLDWLLEMVSGDEPYHQVSGIRDFDLPFRLPESDTRTPIPDYVQRPAFRFHPGAGANLLARVSATFVLASQVFDDDSRYAGRLVDQAFSTYTEAKRPERSKPQASIPSWLYPEDSVQDDLALAAAFLWEATHEEVYRNEALTFALNLETLPGAPVRPASVDALALAEAALAFPEGSIERSALAQRLGALAEPIRALASAPRGPGAAFGYAVQRFGATGTSLSLGAAAACLAARSLGQGDGCAVVARDQVHFLFGQNPFGLSFAVGLGAPHPVDLHDGVFQVTGRPPTGGILGGPTSVQAIQEARANDRTIPLPTTTDALARYSTDDLLFADHRDDTLTTKPSIELLGTLLYVLSGMQP